MKTIEEIKTELTKKMNDEIEKAKIEIEIRGSLIIQPKYLHVYPLYNSAGTICYKVKTKQDAFNIYKTFTVSPSFKCKSNNTVSIKCFDDETAKEVTEYYAGIEISQHNATLNFFTVINGNTWRVEIELPVHLFGRFVKDHPNAKINYKLFFVPVSLLCACHRIVHYAGYGRGDAGFISEIWAMYEAYEVADLMEVER